jgi:hypothetical protein
MSAEIEAQLRRSLVDYGSGPTFALTSLIAKVVDNVVRVRGSGRWWEDPYQFALAVRAVSSTFGMFKPHGEPPADIDYLIVDFARQSLLRDVQRADVAKAPETQTAHERWMSALKRDLGPLAYFPLTFGQSAMAVHDTLARVKPFIEEYKTLTRKKAKAPGGKMTDDEEKRLLELRKKLAEIPQ